MNTVDKEDKLLSIALDAQLILKTIREAVNNKYEFYTQEELIDQIKTDIELLLADINGLA